MIDLSTINPFNLPSLPLEQCRKLPNYSGIYFVLSASDDILYIGCSANLQERWIVHHRYQQFQEIGNVRISWLQVQDASQVNVIEQELISYFNPLLNKRRILKDGKTSQHKWNDANQESIKKAQLAYNKKRPIWSFRPAPTILEWLEKERLKDKNGNLESNGVLLNRQLKKLMELESKLYQ